MSKCWAPPCQPPRAPSGLVTSGGGTAGDKEPSLVATHAAARRASQLTSACSGKGETVASALGHYQGTYLLPSICPEGLSKPSAIHMGKLRLTVSGPLFEGGLGSYVLAHPPTQMRVRYLSYTSPEGQRAKGPHAEDLWGLLKRSWGHKGTSDLTSVEPGCGKTPRVKNNRQEPHLIDSTGSNKKAPETTWDKWDTDTPKSVSES